MQVLEYISFGWAVFPLHSIDDGGHCTCGNKTCTDAGKHPRLVRGLKEASKDTEIVTKWFDTSAPLSNIGVVTGDISGITIIDIDIGDGKLGAESWAEAIDGHGEPETLIANTGSGGLHFVFKYNSALKTSSNTLGKGVDCRNDGGYVVAAPSRHRSGGIYSWLNWGSEICSLPSHLSKRKENRGRPKKDDMYRSKYTIEQVKGMLDHISAEDRDLWRNIGVILGREFKLIDEAWELYVNWSDGLGGKKGRNHDEIMREAFYELSQQESAKNLTIGTIVKNAIDSGWSPKKGEVPVGHFVYYAPGNNYIYRPTTTHWIAPAVDAAVSPINEDGKITQASEWLKEHQLVTSMTCEPAIDDDYIKGFDCRNGEILKTPGAALYNTYRKPTIELGDARLAKPFLEHVHKVFPKDGDAEQFLNYMAHRVQKPSEKPRFALLIAGSQGVGKDTAIEFCCPAIGAWNVANIDPSALEGNFNEYCASTLVRVSEAANLHEMTKWAFNERMKVLIAGSPDTQTINPKYGQKYSIRMYCGIIITTNHLSSGIYIPEDDRRYDIIDSATLAEMGLLEEATRKNYFSDLWDWFLEDGKNHIAAYLHEKDLSSFSPNNGQRKTDAHHSVVASGLSSDHWLDDILDALGRPVGVRSDVIFIKAVAEGEKDSDVRRKLSGAMGRAGYVLHRNPSAKDGRWKINGKNRTVYVIAGTNKSYDPREELSIDVF